jgi:hypothetical protein
MPGEVKPSKTKYVCARVCACAPNKISFRFPKVVWDKTLKMIFFQYNAFSTSRFQQIASGFTNHLPWFFLIIPSRILNCILLFIMLLQQPIGTRFCNQDKQIQQAYDDM